MTNCAFQSHNGFLPLYGSMSYETLPHLWHQSLASPQKLEVLYQFQKHCYESSLFVLHRSKLQRVQNERLINIIHNLSNPLKVSSTSNLNFFSENEQEKKICKVEAFESTHENLQQQNLSFDQIKSHVTKMIHFFVREFGRNNHESISQEREKYKFNQIFLILFDRLIERYTLASKGREDMIRFVIRKALIFLRNSIKENGQLSSKRASLTFCQKYFETKCEDNEGELTDFLLPYKKNSKNKTANNRFISEIFASDVFSEDYLTYLENFDKIFQEDNDKKISTFTSALISCVKERNFEKIKTFKRLPWLSKWFETSKIIAYELLQNNKTKGIEKKNLRLIARSTSN